MKSFQGLIVAICYVFLAGCSRQPLRIAAFECERKPTVEARTECKRLQRIGGRYLGGYSQLSGYGSVDKIPSKQARSIVHYERGNAFYSTRQYSMAVVEYGKATRLSPKFAEAYVKMSLSFVKLKKFQPALQAIEKAELLRPDWSLPHFQKGLVLSYLGQPDLALKAFEDTIASNKYHIEAYYNIASIYKNRGDEELARDAYEETWAIFERKLDFDAQYLAKNPEFESVYWATRDFLKQQK